MSQRGWQEARPAFGFVLVAARDQPLTSVGIASLLGVTKQAASKLIDAMEAAGYVQRQADAADGRVKLVGLTKRGHDFLDDAEDIYRELEAEWDAVLGAGRVEALRSDVLTALQATHGDQLPPVRPTW